MLPLFILTKVSCCILSQFFSEFTHEKKYKKNMKKTLDKHIYQV